MAVKKKNQGTGRDASRVSFAKVTDALTVPDLLALQTESFDWLINKPTPDAKSGLEEIFEEISPIENDRMQLSFTNPYLEPVKYDLNKCKEEGRTFAAPLYVEAEFMNHDTGEIKTQTVFMGDFPLMTPKGTFVINGTERVVVSQLVRSPGVYFEKVDDKTTDKDLYSCRVIPSRGAWLEFEIDKRDQIGVRIDRKRRQSVTVFLKALGMTSEEILKEFPGSNSIQVTLDHDTVLTQDEALKDIYRKLRPGEQVATEAARSLLDNFYFNAKRFDLAKVGRYKLNRKLGIELPKETSVLTLADIKATIKYLIALHEGVASQNDYDTIHLRNIEHGRFILR